MKPSRSRDQPVDPSTTPEGNRDQPATAEPEPPLTREERARLLAELEAELEAAERSIAEEGTISTEELLEQRARYWAGLGSSEKGGKASRRIGLAG